MTLNKSLLKTKKVSKQQESNLNDLHELLVLINKQAKKSFNDSLEPGALSFYSSIIESIEFQMQSNWNFNQDKAYHRYQFDLPNCQCPSMDNHDRIGTKYRIFNQSCVYHGQQKDTN